MTSSEQFWIHHSATETDKYPDLSPEDIQGYYNYFAQARRQPFVYQEDEIVAAEERMIALRGEIDRQHSDTRHKENQTLSQKILCVAKWTLAAAIVVPIVVALLAEILPSMLHRAKSSESLPVSSPTASMTAAPIQSTTQSASPIESSIVSPTPSESSTPKLVPQP